MSRTAVLTLPAIPTISDPKTFLAECDAAIGELTTLNTATQRTLGDAVTRNLPKAVAALKRELSLIQGRNRAVRIAKCRAEIATATKEAESWDRKASDALPAVTTAEAALKAAEAVLEKAKEAHRWPESRADLHRSRVDVATRELRDIEAPKGMRPGSASIGTMERTESQELGMVRRR